VDGFESCLLQAYSINTHYLNNNVLAMKKNWHTDLIFSPTFLVWELLLNN